MRKKNICIKEKAPILHFENRCSFGQYWIWTSEFYYARC